MKEKFNKYICDFEGCRHRNEENVCCLFNQENCVYYRTLHALNGYKAIAKRCDDCKKIKELEAQIEKMKCCQNCKHCSEIISYKVLGGKEISKICSDGHYVCDKWEIKEK